MQMPRRVKNMQGYVLGAQDGEIGPCSDFLSDGNAILSRPPPTRVARTRR